MHRVVKRVGHHSIQQHQYKHLYHQQNQQRYCCHLHCRHLPRYHFHHHYHRHHHCHHLQHHRHHHHHHGVLTPQLANFSAPTVGINFLSVTHLCLLFSVAVKCYVERYVVRCYNNQCYALSCTQTLFASCVATYRRFVVHLYTRIAAVIVIHPSPAPVYLRTGQHQKTTAAVHQRWGCMGYGYSPADAVYCKGSAELCGTAL